MALAGPLTPGTLLPPSCRPPTSAAARLSRSVTKGGTGRLTVSDSTELPELMQREVVGRPTHGNRAGRQAEIAGHQAAAWNGNQGVAAGRETAQAGTGDTDDVHSGDGGRAACDAQPIGPSEAQVELQRGPE